MSIDNLNNDLEKENKRLKKKLEKSESSGTYYKRKSESTLTYYKRAIGTYTGLNDKQRLEGFKLEAEIKSLKEENEQLKAFPKNIENEKLKREVEEEQDFKNRNYKSDYVSDYDQERKARGMIVLLILLGIAMAVWGASDFV